MTWSGVELAEFSPGSPTALTVLDDRWIFILSSNLSGGGAYNAGHFAIVDATDGSSRSFSGLISSTRTEGLAAASAGSVWTLANAGPSNQSWLQQVTGGGGISTHGIRPQRGSVLVGTPGWVAGGHTTIWLFDTDTQTERWSTNVTANSRLGVINGRLICVAANFVELSVADGSTLNTWPTPVAPHANQRGVPVGNRLYFAATGGAVWVDPTTGATGIVAATPSGMPDVPSYTPGPDGYLYGLTATGSMVVFDPATGRWADRALPTVRGRRYAIIPAAGKLWVPSGEPVGV